MKDSVVKEEKILLIAQESNDEKTIINAIKQIVQNCVLDKLDINKLPVTDLEFLFLNLRARSIGELIDLQYKCNNDVIDEYIHINPAIENVMIQDAKKLPQVEQPAEFVRQAEIFLN